MIRRKTGEEVEAFTFPLLIDKASGRKFGKSEGNAVWLDAEKTSAFAFYQFFINIADEMVEDLLKRLTLLPLAEIEVIIQEWEKDKGSRSAQKILALEVTKIVHGEKMAEAAKAVSEILFGQMPEKISPETTELLKREAPAFEFSDLPKDLPEILVAVNLASSKREARQFLKDGAVKIFDEKVGEEREISKNDFRDGILLLRRGKKNLAVVFEK